MTITMLYAGLLALVLLGLALNVIKVRGATHINVGDGGNEKLIRAMRGQGNFIEYVPLCVLMLAALEMAGLSALCLHILGAALLLGRLMHGYAFAISDYSPIGRTGGIVLTFLVLFAEALLCVYLALQQLI